MKYSGTFIGILVGLISGLGMLNQIKKSQRTPQLTLIAVGIGVVSFGVAGFKIGNTLDYNIKIEKDLGHDNLMEDFVQKGRVWIAETQWTNKDGVTYSLKTGQTQDKTLVSQIDGVIIYNHEVKSGSIANVTKFHRLARNQIFERQKLEYKMKVQS